MSESVLTNLGDPWAVGPFDNWRTLMRTTWLLSTLVLGASLLVTSSCTTAKDLEPYATKDELSAYATKGELEALRSEMLMEIRKAQEAARAAEQNAAAAAASADQAADDARAASEKAEAIFRKSLRK
jgi:hypothetical protein